MFANKDHEFTTIGSAHLDAAIQASTKFQTIYFGRMRGVLRLAGHSQATTTKFGEESAMTDTKILLLDLLAVIPDGDKSAALFAEDGVLELPFLHAVGIPNSLRGSYGDQGVL